jgi:hypothetical protein
MGTLVSVASLLAARLYQGNPDRNQKIWNIVSTEIYSIYAGAVGVVLHTNDHGYVPLVVNTSRSFPHS